MERALSLSSRNSNLKTMELNEEKDEINPSRKITGPNSAVLLEKEVLSIRILPLQPASK